jgi:hypothetical protein
MAWRILSNLFVLLMLMVGSWLTMLVCAIAYNAHHFEEDHPHRNMIVGTIMFASLISGIVWTWGFFAELMSRFKSK